MLGLSIEEETCIPLIIISNLEIESCVKKFYVYRSVWKPKWNELEIGRNRTW